MRDSGPRNPNAIRVSSRIMVLVDSMSPYNLSVGLASPT